MFFWNAFYEHRWYIDFGVHRKFIFFCCVFRVFSVSNRRFCNFCMPNFFSVSPYSFMKIDGNLNHFVKLIEGNFRVPKSSFFDFFVYFFETFFYDFSKKSRKTYFVVDFWGPCRWLANRSFWHHISLSIRSNRKENWVWTCNSCKSWFILVCSYFWNCSN